MATVVRPNFSDYVFWQTAAGAQETFAKALGRVMAPASPFDVVAIKLSPNSSDFSAGGGGGGDVYDTYAHPIG
jgi:hypothetical protein